MSEMLAPRLASIDPSVYLAHGAVVVGDVTILADSSVWFHAVVRADHEVVRIGRGVNIQDGAVLHADPGFPCVVGDGVTIGHRAIVHGAKIDENVTIGMGSIVMNGAQIGRDCIVAAGAVVTEGVVAPPGSLVIGVPAKVRRSLSPEEIERNLRSAQHYVDNARRFLAGRYQLWVG